MKHVISDSRLLPFLDLRRTYSLPIFLELRYWQLRHAIRVKFSVTMVLESNPIECLLSSGVMRKPLSSFYLYLSVVHDAKLI